MPFQAPFHAIPRERPSRGAVIDARADRDLVLAAGARAATRVEATDGFVACRRARIGWRALRGSCGGIAATGGWPPAIAGAVCIGNDTRGGTSNFSSTSTHSACTNHAERMIRAARNANSARQLAASALLAMICRRSAMVQARWSACPGDLTFRGFFRPRQFVHQRSQGSTLLGGERLRANQMRQQGGQRPAAGLVRQGLQSTADEFLA